MSPLVTRPIAPSFFDARDDTLVTWLGMAGVLVNSRGTVLFVDPIISLCDKDGERVSECGHRMVIPLPIAADDVPKADAVLYTHTDGDHFTEVTATILDRRKPVFFAPPPVTRRLRAAGVARERTTTAVDFERTAIGDVTIVATPALHDYRQPKPFARGDCVGFLLETPDGAIWHPGDTRLIDDLLEVKNVDVMFFDVAAVEAHLGPSGSAALARSCGARLLLAYHYGTLDLPPGSWGNCDPMDSLPFVEDVPARFYMPQPGEIVRMRKGELPCSLD